MKSLKSAQLVLKITIVFTVAAIIFTSCNMLFGSDDKDSGSAPAPVEGLVIRGSLPTSVLGAASSLGAQAEGATAIVAIPIPYEAEYVDVGGYQRADADATLAKPLREALDTFEITSDGSFEISGLATEYDWLLMVADEGATGWDRALGFVAMDDATAGPVYIIPGSELSGENVLINLGSLTENGKGDFLAAESLSDYQDALGLSLEELRRRARLYGAARLLASIWLSEDYTTGYWFPTVDAEYSNDLASDGINTITSSFDFSAPRPLALTRYGENTVTPSSFVPSELSVLGPYGATYFQGTPVPDEDGDGTADNYSYEGSDGVERNVKLNNGEPADPDWFIYVGHPKDDNGTPSAPGWELTYGTDKGWIYDGSDYLIDENGYPVFAVPEATITLEADGTFSNVDFTWKVYDGSGYRTMTTTEFERYQLVTLATGIRTHDRNTEFTVRSDLAKPYTGFAVGDLVDDDTGDSITPEALENFEVVIGYYVFGSMLAFNWQFSS